MAIPTVAIDETKPAGTRGIKLGDNDIREFKVQNREILEVDHDYPSSGQSATAGQHKQVTLQEAADIGTGAEGVPILGAQTIDDEPELVYTTEDDDDIQITNHGLLLPGQPDNDTYIVGTDNAGTGTVDIVKVNTDDDIVLGTDTVVDGKITEVSTHLTETTAPSTAAGEGALYTKDTDGQPELFFREESDGDEVQITSEGSIVNKSFQSAVSKTAGTTYEATTDGFVRVSINLPASGAQAASFYTDSNSNPTTQYKMDLPADSTGGNSASFPIISGDYYKLVISGNASVIHYDFVALS